MSFALHIKAAGGVVAACFLGRELVVPNADGVAAIFPVATAAILWLAAIWHHRGPDMRRVFGLFMLWGACSFANRPLRDAGWSLDPVEHFLAPAVAIVFCGAGRLLLEPGPSVLRWPLVALAAVVVLAFAWPPGQSQSVISPAAGLVYGVMACVAIASFFTFQRMQTCPNTAQNC